MNKRLLTYYLEKKLWEGHRIILPEHREALAKYYHQCEKDALKELKRYATPPDNDDL